MKKTMKFTVIVSALLLTACGAEPISSEPAPIYDTPTEAAHSVSSGEPEKEESADNNDGFTGYGGEALKREMFVEKSDPNETKPNFVSLHCELNYGYTALFDGSTYNSYDEPEKFDFENWEAIEIPEAVMGDYFILSEGDKAGGLTCSRAVSSYIIIPGSIDEPHLYRSFVCFDGEVEVTGYVDRCDGDEAYMDEGQLLFYPDGDSWRGLPVPCRAQYFTYHMNDGGFVYAPFRLSLGTVYDYPSLGLEHDIPQGTTAHMKLVLKDIGLVYGDGDFSGYTISSAVIVSAEKID